MAFTQKLIDITFTIANGNFQGGGNSVTAKGLRCQVNIDIKGNEGGSDLVSCAIYGLPLSIMNQLSNVGTQYYLRNQANTISISAGDAQTGMFLVYKGLIFNAFVDGLNQPQVCFRVTGNGGGGYWASQQVPPISKPGPQNAATMLGSLAGQMGMQFENNGVNTILMNPYYPGTPWQQAVRIARHANIDLFLDRGTMAITPAGQPRSGDPVLISPQTGMKDYPAFRDKSIIVKALFAPTVKPGGLIQVQSQLTPANGIWRIYHMLYELDSFTPNGPWFMTLEGTVVSTKGGT